MTPAGPVRLIGPEVRLLVRRPLNWLIALLLLAAMMIAAAGGAARVRTARSEVARAAAEAAHARVAARTIAQAQHGLAPPAEQYRDPTDPYGYLFYFAHIEALRPPARLALLATGDGDLRASTLRIGPGRVLADGAGVVANPRLARIGSFDLAFVLVYLVPLALIAWTGTTLSGERDSGVLRLIAAQPVSLRGVVLAKFVAAVLLAVPAVVTSFWLSLALQGAVAPDTLPLLRTLSLALCLYALFWIALAAIVVRHVGAAASLVRLVIVWAVLLFLVPQGADWVSRAAVPPPSGLAMINAARTATARFDADPVGRTAAWLAPRGRGASADLPTRTDVQRVAQDAMVRDATASFRKAGQRREEAASVWRRWAVLLSPGLVLDRMVAETAGNDASGFATFLHAADDASSRIERRFEPAILGRVPADGTGADTDRIRRYEAETAPLVILARPHRVVGLMLLAAWTVLALTLSVLAWHGRASEHDFS